MRFTVPVKVCIPSPTQPLSGKRMSRITTKRITGKGHHQFDREVKTQNEKERGGEKRDVSMIIKEHPNIINSIRSERGEEKRDVSK